MGTAVTARDTTSAFDSPTFNLDMSIRVDQPVGSMSISPSGRDVVLASRQGLHIVDLDNPYDPPRFLQHRTAWEVADVQWSPFAARDYWVVSTSNQKAMVWNLAMPSRRAIEHVLHSHTRAITDINFSAHHPDILATCSVDSFVHCWDLRDPRRPAMSFCDWFAGATQVKYNRQDEHILASSHDKYLRIWDDRKGAYPLRSFCAHTTKIYGVDWNRTRSTGVVTCALDKTIRFWDYSRPDDEPERVIRTSFPVWRARHTPFGWGLLIMPQRADNTLYLYDRRAEGDAPADPVEKFEGHTDSVKEFLWRYRGGQNPDRDDREFQLVSWSQDKDIRLWSISKDLMKRIGHDPEGKVRFRITRKGAAYKTFRHEQKLGKGAIGDGMSVGKRLFGPRYLGEGILGGQIQYTDGQFSRRYQTTMGISRGKVKSENPIAWMKGIKITKLSSWDNPDTLGEEISFVGAKFPKVKFEKVNVTGRYCTISLNGPWGVDSKWVFLRAEIQFPSGYPESATPIFTIEKTNAIPSSQMEAMAMQLRKISEAFMEHKKMSLEACIKFLLGEPAEHTMVFIGSGDEKDSTSDDEELNPQQSEVKDLIANNNQVSVPLPRACGATWSHDGRLVCFFPPKEETTRREFGGGGCWWNRDLSSSAFGWREGAERSGRSGRLFENFGRLYMSTPGPKGLRGVSSAGESSSGSEYETSTTDASDSEDETSTLRPALSWRLQGNAGGALGRRFPGGRRGGVSTDRSTQRSGTARPVAMSTGTGVGVGNWTNSIGYMTGKNIVRLIDLSQLLPSKKELAEEYIVYGHGSDVCKHNAEVARRHGYLDLADVWTLAELIVSRDVPLEVVPQSWGRDPILVVAKNVLAAAKRRDSGFGDDEDEEGTVASHRRVSIMDDEFALHDDSDDSLSWVKKSKVGEICGKIKWGGHPLGSSWLIDQLFSYFEMRADVQMLAMLACVFCEAEYKPGDSVPWLNTETGNDLLLTMKGPAYSIDYYSTYDAAKDEFPSLSVSPQPHSVAVTPVTTHGSFSSYNGFLGGVDPFSSGAYSTGNTPPVSSGFLTRRSMDEVSHHSLSSSPEFTHHHSRRSTAVVNFAGGFARAFNTTSSNSSPPTRRRPSPAESIINMTTGTGVITWGQNTIIGSGLRGAAGAEGGGVRGAGGSSILTETEEDDDEGVVDIDIKILNSGVFDDEGTLSKPPLLNPAKAKQYRAYREKYADLLYVWGLQVRRLEILKINSVRTVVDEEGDKLNVAIGDSTDGFAKKSVKKSDKKWTGLELTGTCSKCHSTGVGPYTPLNKASHTLISTNTATSTHRFRPTRFGGRSQQHAASALSNQDSPMPSVPECSCSKPTLKPSALTCVICQVAVKGLYGACLVCGHVAHAKCHRDWFCPSSDSEDDETTKAAEGNEASSVYRGEQECPAGCGCRCIDYADDGFGFMVPPPVPLGPPVPTPNLLSKQSFGFGKRVPISTITALGGVGEEQGRIIAGSSGGNYGYLAEEVDEDFFEDELGEEEEYDEEDADGMLGTDDDEDANGAAMFDLQTPVVQVSDYGV
ncbi:hypothetical protein BDZ91DRAFT_689427 [Kalaharituber pfeilii]|nr:hypothetical protein BDZ91DRAFT_689427 [Kalaharituber pfeilii]